MQLNQLAWLKIKYIVHSVFGQQCRSVEAAAVYDVWCLLVLRVGSIESEAGESSLDVSVHMS